MYYYIYYYINYDPVQISRDEVQGCQVLSVLHRHAAQAVLLTRATLTTSVVFTGDAGSH